MNLVTYLGFRISEQVVSPAKDQIAAIKSFTPPQINQGIHQILQLFPENGYEFQQGCQWIDWSHKKISE